MTLLKTNVLPNSLVAHGPNHLLAYQAGEVKRYRKNSDNTLLLRATYPLADVKRLAISENGQNMAAQTPSKTVRLHMPDDDPLVTTGAMAISDSNYLIVCQPTAVQVIREMTVLLTASTSNADKVCCGLNSFVVYSGTRTLTGTYTGFVLTEQAQAKTLLHVAHTGSDKFAFFYSDGSVSLSGVSRPLTALKGHRTIGQHVVANDGVDEWTYMRKFPLTAPVKLRPYVAPPPPLEMFTLADNLPYTASLTNGVTFEEFPSIGDATAVLPAGNQDLIEFTFAQAINLSDTDWTLEWSSKNLAASDGYFAEIAMLPAVGNFGITARYGDSGFGQRLQFGGSVSGLSSIYNAKFTKTALNNVVKEYRLVKQGTRVFAYVNNVKQNLAIGTSTTYDQPSFPVDSDLTAIKRVLIGAVSSGGLTMPAYRGPVKLSLSAIFPPLPAQPKLIYDEAYSRATSFANFSFNFTDDYYAIPSKPLKLLDRNLVEQPITTPSDVNYANVHFMDYPNAALAATGSYGYRTANNGVSWTAIGAADSYRTGMAIRHKGFNYIYNAASANWTKAASGVSGGTIVTSNIGAKAVNTSNYISKNDNAVLISQSTAATPTLLYVSWDYPATVFSYYVSGLTTNTQIYYVGSNVFACANGNRQVVLLFVPETAGAPTVLKTIEDVKFMAHLKDALVWETTGNLLYTAPLSARADNTSAKLADARAYAEDIVAAMELGNELLPRSSSRVFRSRWGFDRLVEGDLNRVRIWQF